jgi:hypothetical protein
MAQAGENEVGKSRPGKYSDKYFNFSEREVPYCRVTPQGSEIAASLRTHQRSGLAPSGFPDLVLDQTSAYDLPTGRSRMFSRRSSPCPKR